MNFYGLLQSVKRFSVSLITIFMEFRVYEEHARNATGINVISYVISSTTVDKKSNIAAWAVFHVIDIYMFIKRHKLDEIEHGTRGIFLLKIKAVCVSNGLWILSFWKIFDLSNLKIGLHFAIAIRLIQPWFK